MIVCYQRGLRTSRQELTKESVKRSRKTEDEDPIHDSKRRKKNQTKPDPPTSIRADPLIHTWLETISGNCNVDGLQEAIPPDDIAPKRSLNAPSIIAPTDASAKSSKTSIETREPNFRDCAERRNIYIYRGCPSNRLMQRARDIVFNQRSSPELDDDAAVKLVNIAEQMEAEPEEVIAQGLAAELIPAMRQLPDSRIGRALNQLWTDAVLVPTRSSVLEPCLPLSKPKPGCAFGFSKSAFTSDQQEVAHLLVDQFGRSYARPDKNLLYPFLSIDFKSEATGGTHHIGTNQAANAGAIALHGFLESMRRTSSVDDFNYDEPKFFSMTLDAAYVKINVHWVRKTSKEGEFEFHVTKIARHNLDNENGVKAVQRSAKNILEYGLNKQLPILSTAFDNYRTKITAVKEIETFAEQEPTAKEDENAKEEAERVNKKPRKRTKTGTALKRKSRNRYDDHSDQNFHRNEDRAHEGKPKQTQALSSWKQQLWTFFSLNP
ncbi:MAG: hypothetical protein Q9167_007420 [Letrouitia subvulpina]